jgi:hypothetical protein
MCKEVAFRSDKYLEGGSKMMVFEDGAVVIKESFMVRCVDEEVIVFPGL